MLEKWPINKKYLPVAAALILLLISYELALKKTIGAWQLHASLSKQLSQSTDPGYQPQYLERKNANLARIIHLYRADTVNFRSNILGTISTVAEKENVRLSEVPAQDPLFRTPRFIIQKLDFEGDYFHLVRLLHRLQATPDVGMIRAAELKSVIPPSGGNPSQKLVLEIYLEIVTD